MYNCSSGEVTVRGVRGRGRALFEAGAGARLLDADAVRTVHRRRSHPPPQQGARQALAARLHRLHQKHRHWRITHQNTYHSCLQKHTCRCLPC